jgi:hypothetical protein
MNELNIDILQEFWKEDWRGHPLFGSEKAGKIEKQEHNEDYFSNFRLTPNAKKKVFLVKTGL